eukprot:m.1267989 g.1267989  ORF g.1267989 m.1267989 type:complete len:2057 (+) comp24744_c0_seq4:288-6458(+)
MDEEEDYSRIPLVERVVHKVWKVRAAAYDEVAALFTGLDDPSAPEFAEYSGIVKKFVVDSNAMAQGKGIAAASAFVRCADVKQDLSQALVNGIVTKCLNSSKAATKEGAIELCKLLIEATSTSEDVIGGLIVGFSHKQPKIAAGTALATLGCIEDFGVPTINVKPLLHTTKGISILFGHTSADVREVGKRLTCELHKWLGPVLEKSLQSIKPVQLKELVGLWVEFPQGSGTTSRLTAQEQMARGATGHANNGGNESNDSTVDVEKDSGHVEVDMYDMVDAVKVKIPSSFYKDVIATKWSERKEALQNLHKILDSPKIDPASDFQDTIKPLINVVSSDSNVLNVAFAAKCLGALACGLRSHFQPHAITVLTVLLEKFKEKKANVVSALGEACDHVIKTAPAEKFADHLVAALKNKNPSVKQECSNVVCRAVTSGAIVLTPPNHKAFVKALAPVFVANLAESQEPVREAASQALAALITTVGERAIAPHLDKADTLRAAKVREIAAAAPPPGRAAGASVGGATTRAAPSALSRPKTSGGSGAASRAARPSTAGASRRPHTAGGKENVVPAKASSLATKKKSGGTSGGASRGPGSKFADVVTDVTFADMSLEDAIAAVTESDICDGSLLEQLADPLWKERLAAATQLQSNVEQQESLDPSVTLGLYKVIEAKSKRWKDSNFQVMNKNFDILGIAAAHAQVFPDRCVHVAVPGLIAKIGDTKINKHASSCLSVLCENWSVNEVSIRACMEAKNNHSPKVKEETLKWMAATVEQFGVRIALKPHVEFSKHCLSHTNPAVRKSCVEFLGILFRGVGSRIQTPFAKEKQATLDILDAEFARAAGESLPAPERFERGTSGTDGSSGGSGTTSHATSLKLDGRKTGGSVAVDYDASIPRVLLADIVRKGTLEMMGDKNWKLRAEALDNMVTAVKTEQPLAPELGDYAAALLARLGDTNKNLVTTTLNVLAAIGPLMGPPVKKYLAHFLDAVLSTLADGKDTVRAAGVAVLDSWHDQIGLLPFVDAAADKLAAALTSGKPHEQCAVLVWLRAKLTLVAHSPPNVKALVKPLVTCMEDRNKDVRQAAVSLFEDMVGYLGPEKLRKSMAGSLQGPLKATVADILANHGADAQPATASKAILNKPSSVRPKTAGSSTRAAKTKTTQAKTAGTKDRSKTSRDTGSDAGDAQLVFDGKGKSKRHKDERTSKALKWAFTAPREEFVLQLQEQFKTCATAQLQKMLFSSDFRLHIKALEHFIEALGTDEGRTNAFASVDVLLKWITLRYFDSNPTVQLKAMTFLQELFQAMSSEGIELSDWEAAAFLPFLVNQSGSKLESIRHDIHGLFRLIGHTYPSSKMFQHILDGLKSKNAKQRCECLIEASSMIERLGMSVCQMGAAKTLVVIAKQIADRDNSVRTAALNCIVAVWNILGDDVFKLMGDLQPKHATLVTERIKRHGSRDRPVTAPAAPDDRSTARAASPAKASVLRKSLSRRSPSGGNADSTRTSSGSVRQEFSLNLDTLAQPAHFDATQLELAPTEIDFDDTPIDLDLHHSARQSVSPTEGDRKVSLEGGVELSMASSTDSHGSGGSMQEEPRPTYVDSIAENLVSSIPLQAINALKAAEDELNQDKAFLDVHANAILSACTTQARLLFAVHFQTDDADAVALAVRLCKHLLGFVLQAFRNSSVIQNVSREVLSTMISDLLAHVQSPQLAKLAEGSQITKALNCILLKILQSVKPNLAFAILFEIMNTSLHNSTLADKPKHIQLVQRCIWKLVKALPDEIDAVDAGDLLVGVNEFLASNPPAVDPATEDEDIPTRTMRTVVAALVKCKGAGIKEDAGALVPAGGDPYRTAAGYMLLQALTRAGLADGESSFAASPSSTASPTSDGRAPPARGVCSAEEQEERLVQIFAMITSKDETKQGMEALYDFQLQFPAADTDKFLQTTSPFFQTHIRRCLADIKRRRQHRHSAHAPGARASVVPGPKSAATYLDRLRQLTERNRPTTAPGGAAESGGDTSRFGFRMPERDGTPELPAVERGSGDVGSSPPSSPSKVAPSQLASLKARLAKFHNK